MSENNTKNKTFDYTKLTNEVHLQRQNFIRCFREHPTGILLNPEAKRIISGELGRTAEASYDMENDTLRLFGLPVYYSHKIKPEEVKVFFSL